MHVILPNWLTTGIDVTKMLIIAQEIRFDLYRLRLTVRL
jgi:hypothetical protein